jgi:hypothetical protein
MHRFLNTFIWWMCLINLVVFALLGIFVLVVSLIKWRMFPLEYWLALVVAMVLMRVMMLLARATNRML